MNSHTAQRFSYYFSLSLRFTAQAFLAWEQNGCADRIQGKSGRQPGV